MSEQIKRLDAHTDHLLNGFLDLRSKYSILEPMLLDKELQKKVSDPRVHGFLLIRHVLFLSCSQDLAKLAFDQDKRSPSLSKIVAALADEGLRDELRQKYALITPKPWSAGNADPDMQMILEEWDAQDEAQRQAEYDEMYVELVEKWNVFAAQEVCQAFRDVRDKVAAHSELRLIDTEYKPVDIGELGIGWRAIGTTIADMQPLVVLVNMLVRSCSFGWDSYEQHMQEVSTEFWSRASR